jgi:hypothetical protein
MRKPFEISTGAWWIVPDGRTIAVSSFHESWLSAHPAIAGGALHTVDFVQKSGWLSATQYSDGMPKSSAADILEPRRSRPCANPRVNGSAIRRLSLCPRHRTARLRQRPRSSTLGTAFGDSMLLPGRAVDLSMLFCPDRLQECRIFGRIP